MVTTQGSEPQVLEAIANGASGYIKKPFTNKQMEDNMKSLLEYCKDKAGSAESSCPCLK